MALELITTDRAEYGDIAALASLTAISVAVTLTPDSPLTGNRICGQWSADSSNCCFLMQPVDTDEIGFVVRASNAVLEGKKTTDTPLVAGTQIRIVCTWNAPDAHPAVVIWVNGAQRAMANWFNSNILSTADSDETVFVGHEVDTIVDGIDGDYSEFAIWTRKLDDGECIAYGKGMSPACFPRGLVLYDKMVTTGSAFDIVGGVTPTLTGAANATHPTMRYPQPPLIHKYRRSVLKRRRSGMYSLTRMGA